MQFDRARVYQVRKVHRRSESSLALRRRRCRCEGGDRKHGNCEFQRRRRSISDFGKRRSGRFGSKGRGRIRRGGVDQDELVIGQVSLPGIERVVGVFKDPGRFVLGPVEKVAASRSIPTRPALGEAAAVLGASVGILVDDPHQGRRCLFETEGEKVKQTFLKKGGPSRKRENRPFGTRVSESREQAVQNARHATPRDRLR